jgi:hypothetical protein
VTSRLVFRLVVPTGSAGSTSTVYVSTRGFRTASTDTPASTYVQERVAKAGGFARSLFSGGALGGLIKPNYGVLVLNNEDGGLDTVASYAGGGGTVTCWWGADGAAFPAGYTQVYSATIASVIVDMQTVTIRQQDRFEQLARPIVTATFAGSGGLEGSDTAARKKQLVLGSPGLVPLVLIDKALQVYYVQANATDLDTLAGLTEFGVVFEGGVPITRGVPYTFSGELFSAAEEPAPGTFRLWSGYTGFSVGPVTFGSLASARSYTKGPLYVRLGGVPVGELRFGAVGRLQNLARVPSREWRFSDLCNRAGLSDVEPATMAPMQGVVADFTAGNRLIDGDQTYAQVMGDRCQALLGAAGFDRLDRFFCLTLTDPESGSDASAFTFTADNSRDFTRLPPPGYERPVWQVNVRAGRSWPCTVFSGASAEMQDVLTREGHYVRFRGHSSTVRRRYPNAMSVDLTIDGHDMPDEDSQADFVDRFGALFGTRRDLMSLRCLQFDADTLTLDLHDKVTLTLARLGYDAGEMMRIVGIELDLDAQQIKFTLWGTNTGFSDWSLTGGAFPADAGEPGGSWGGDDPPPDVVSGNVGLGINALMGDFTGLLVGGPIASPVPADADSFAAAMGDFTGVISGAIVGDPSFADVVLLVQGGADGDTTINDQSSAGDSASIVNYASWSDASQVFGVNMIETTAVSAGIAAFESTGSASRFGRDTGDKFTIECWVNVVALENYASSSFFFAWWGSSGRILELGTYGFDPKWRMRNGDDTELTAATTYGEHFLQLNIDETGAYTLDVDGVEVFSGTNIYQVATGGDYLFHVAAQTGTGNAAGSSTRVYVSPLRFTKGVLRPRGSVPSGEFPTS